MDILIQVALLSILLGAASGSPAQGQTLHTESDFVDAIRANNLLAAASRTQAAADAERPRQVRRPFPMADVMFMPSMIADGSVGVGVMVSQAIPWPARLNAERDARTAIASASAYESEVVLRDQIRQGREAYAQLWGLSARRARIDSFRTSLEIYKESALSQVQAGRGSQQSVLALRVEAEGLEQQLVAIDEELSELRATVAILTGGTIRIDPGNRFAEPLWVIETGDAQLEGHPTLLAADAAREAAQSEIRMNRIMLRPEVSIGATIYPAGTGPEMSEYVVPSIGLSLPLWRGGIRAQIREAELRERQLQLEMEHARLMLSTELTDLASQFNRVRDRIDRYSSDLLPLAHQSLENALLGYRTGTLRLLELLDAQRMALDLELDLIDARVRAAVLVARIEFLTTPE